MSNVDTTTNRRRGRRWLRVICFAAVLALAAMQLATAIIMTPYCDYINMLEDQQYEFVTATVFNNIKHDPDKANCVGEYFSGTMDDQDGGYYHFQQGLDELDERYKAGTLGNGEESYVQRIILKLIKQKCGV